MCFQKTVKVIFILVALAILAFFGGCEAMDSLSPSAGIYKINININDTPLDECSFIVSGDNIRPFFEESVSKDPDITALIVFLKGSAGEIVGDRIIYSLENDNLSPTDKSAPAAEDEIVIPVKSLDDVLPNFPLPENLQIGRYTLVSQIMSGKNILQKTEKPFYYLAKTGFIYEGIEIYLPGSVESSRLIPRGTVVMLETKLNFDSRLDPYIIWYNGKRKVGEGFLSDGADRLFWKAPEQSGFFSLRAEVFPVWNFDRLSGYQKSVSLLVSSNAANVHFITNNIPQLLHWYVFEGNLIDSKNTASTEKALNIVKGDLGWMGVSGTYGLVTDSEKIVSLPKVSVTEKTWQMIFRFLPINDGGVFSVAFGNDVYLHLFIEDQNLIMTLASPSETVSQVLFLSTFFEKRLLDASASGSSFDLSSFVVSAADGSAALPADESISDSSASESSAYSAAMWNSFLTIGINFSILPGLLSAQINIIGDFINSELTAMPIRCEAEIENGFQILLGSLAENKISPVRLSNLNSDSAAQTAEQNFTVIWDEFALYFTPPMEIITAEVKAVAINELPAIAAN